MDILSEKEKAVDCFCQQPETAPVELQYILDRRGKERKKVEGQSLHRV